MSIGEKPAGHCHVRRRTRVIVVEQLAQLQHRGLDAGVSRPEASLEAVVIIHHAHMGALAPHAELLCGIDCEDERSPTT
jgi:hypothetical protein